METLIKQDYHFPRCSFHNQEIVCICVNSLCKRRLICYECVFTDHNKHVTECIPLNLWRIDKTANPKVDSLIDRIGEASSGLKDLGDIIQSYFAKIIERLYLLQEDLGRNKIDLPHILRNMSVCNNYVIKDGFYTIQSEHISNMIDNINFNLIEEIEAFIKEKITSMKKNKGMNLNTIKKTLNRFSTLKDNWSHTTSYWDCLGFQLSEDIILVGFGVYKPDNVTQEFSIKFKLFEGEVKDEKVIFEQDYDTSKVVFETECADLMIGKDIPITKGKIYIAALFNNKANASSKYGKETANIKHDPFTFISYKTTSDSYKSGNYTDLTCGLFPYFIYR
jgi:hypothetical protein